MKIVRRLLDHQRWLNSNGRFGKRFEGECLTFNNCDLEGVDLSGAKITDSEFIGGSVRGACFIDACLADTAFYACDVQDADFSGANVCYAVFETNHEKACLTGALNLDRVSWSKDEDMRKTMERRQSLPAPKDFSH